MPNASTTLIGGWHEQTPGHPQTNRAAEVRFLLADDGGHGSFANRQVRSGGVVTQVSQRKKLAGAIQALPPSPGPPDSARRTVFYAIVELKDAGWITVESTKGGSASHTNQYGFDFKRVKFASPQTGAQDAPPTGAQDAPVHGMGGRGAQFAHEPLRTTHPFGVGGGEENSARRAPDGAAAEFEELRQLWQRPYGTNEVKALAAFNRVTGDGEVTPADILDSARRWVAAREPRFLPKLEEWLANGAWQNDPPTQLNGKHHKPSAAEVAGKPGARSRKERTMTTPKDKLPTPLKTTAVTNLTPWPTQQKVKDLAEDAGPALPLLEQVMLKVSEKLSRQPERLYPQADHRGARSSSSVCEKRLAKRISHRFKDLQKEWDECQPRKLVVNPRKAIALSIAKWPR